MSKGVSLDGVKKVLEKIKELLNKKADKTALTSYVNTYDYNKLTVDANSLTQPGFYRVGSTTENVPEGNNTNFKNWGNLITIHCGNLDTLAQIYFSSRNTTISPMFAARWGMTSEYKTNPWLYFHGSTSPNIPVLKKKTITGETSVNGNLSLYPLTKANAIVLAVIEVENINYASLVCSAYVGNSGAWIAHVISDLDPFSEFKQQEMTVTVYYLEIPSGYQIPDTTPVSSDESLDDSELSPQQNLQ